MKSMKISLLLATILALLTQCGHASVEGMISYWKMDEDTGNIAFDSIGDSNGILIGDPQRPAKIGNALIFDGIDDYVEVPDFSDWNTNITIEAWIYWDPVPSQVWWNADIITILGDTNLWDGYVLYVYNYSDNPVTNGRLAFWSGCDWTNPDSEVLSTAPLSQDEWHHIVATADGTTMSIYVDGILNNSIFQLNSPGLNPGLMIGYDTWPTGHFKGTIDEVAIYNRVLTAEEIYEHYENGLVGIGYLPTIPEAISELVSQVISLNLQSGINNSLDAKLQSALNVLDDLNENNDVAAINSLSAFINAVVAQSGDKIPEDDADTLIQAAVNIINMLSVP